MTASTIFAKGAPRYFTIAPDRPFLADLANTLRAAVDEDPAALADAVIYVPTRRAVRGLLQAFVDTSPNGRASLLPRIKALGDVDEDEFIAFDGGAADEIELAPAISTSERRLALARMVAEKDKAFFDGQRDWAGAVAAADELGKLLDSLYTEEIDATKIKTLAPDTLADHWKLNIEFLSIVTEAWPAYLNMRERMDPAERRIALINRQNAAWKKHPPQSPVIVAGTTGSTPAVARMIKIVASLPKGCAVLPGLDINAPPHVWEAIDEPHPQSGLKQLLGALGIERNAVAPLTDSASQTRRTDLITMALRPAGASDDWRDWAETARKDSEGLAKALDGVELVEAADEEFEAAAIALKFRQTVEDASSTAMLVTPDRDLARRVSMKMRRWGVTVDDSGGVPFTNSPCGTFLRLTAAWLTDISDAVALMSVIDHPLFGGGIAPDAKQKAVLAFDKALRGLRPQGGLQGLAQKLEAGDGFANEGQALLAEIKSLAAQWPEQGASFSERFNAHLAISEALAENEDEDNGRLWRSEDGQAGADLLAQLRDGLDHIAQDRTNDYPAIFSRLISSASVRRRADAHPRLSILGPLEARMQSADIVILGGLNEGTWPRDAAIDPFLSRPMRADLGLPSPERRIGLAAHDFMQLSAAPRLMITRSTRAGGKPAKPSRWVVRLKNILKGADALSHIDHSAYYDFLSRRLDEKEQLTLAKPPLPKPPLEARPKSFYVTRIEKLMRDPYAIYARSILRLKKLDALNEPFGPRHAGELFHKALQDYAMRPLPETHQDRIVAIETLIAENAEAYGMTTDHLAFWQSRISAAADWLAIWDAERRAKGAPAILEGEGVWSFSVNDRDYTLSARADRIDRLNDGTAHLIDYKTGAPPSLKQQAAFSPQLPLTALIAAHSGFNELKNAPVAGFEYLRIIGRGKSSNDTVGATGKGATALIDEAQQGLFELLRHFSDPLSPYPSQPRPQYQDVYGDYDHLARRRERNAQGGEE